MITTDTFLEIGNSHKICEDYIIKGSSPIPFIILADGCSESNNSEMGARILCHLAKQYLRYRQDDLHEIDYKKAGAWIIHNAEMTARQLGLSSSCLDSTLIIAFQLENTIRIFMYGDGTVIQKADNNIMITTVDFSPYNAPYYLSYLVDQARADDYHNLKNEIVISPNMNNVSYKSHTLAYDQPIIFDFHAYDFDALFICSDGISSFIDNNPTARTIHPISEIAPPFMQFKSVKGEFLKRRMKRALKNLNDIGVIHYDDLSIGAFLRS